MYAKAVREHDLEPVDRPKMEVLEESDGRPRRVKATVEVRPEIELAAYKGIPVARPVLPVTDADVERSLAALAKEHATLVPVDRVARIGDVVTLDYAGSVDGVAFDGGSAENQVTELSGGRFIPGFAEGIAGMRAGEQKTVDARFPDDYAQRELAGKTASFAVTLRDVKQLELPPLDDEFAAHVSDNATLESLRSDVRRRLEAISGARERRIVGDAVMQALLQSHEFPLPATMVEGEVDHMMNDAAAAAARAGTTFEKYLESAGKNEEGLRDEYRPDARMRVKGTLLIERIARAEGIVATPADISAELEALARQYRQPVSKVREALGTSLLSLMDGIVRTKTLDFLIDSAEATPAAPPLEETPPAAS